jgi:hypothetical protein
MYNILNMNDKESKVYVVQDPEGKEITDAKSYGTIRVILTGKEHTSQAIILLTQTLKHFKPHDYLLLVGRSINMGIAMHLALRQTGGVLNLLVWHREHWAYTKETINIQEQDAITDWASDDKSTNTATVIRKRASKSGNIRE